MPEPLIPLFHCKKKGRNNNRKQTFDGEYLKTLDKVAKAVSEKVQVKERTRESIKDRFARGKIEADIQA